jgi:hypothetical protein
MLGCLALASGCGGADPLSSTPDDSGEQRDAGVGVDGRQNDTFLMPGSSLDALAATTGPADVAVPTDERWDGPIDVSVDNSLDLPGEGPAEPSEVIDAGGVAATCDEIPCAASLLAPCRPAGTCSVDQVGSPYSSRQCSDNGIRMDITLSVGAGIQQTYMAQNQIGVCYVLSSFLPMSHEAVYYELRDGSSKLVATGVHTTDATGGGLTTITCIGGPPTVVSSGCVDTLRQSNLVCSPGTCP